jgi:hypothetical protein
MSKIKTTEEGSSLEFATEAGIESVVVSEHDKLIKQEAFMNERVTVILQSTADENAPPSIQLSVNGITQPMFRDVPTPVRRMFVEVLARCKETKYKAVVANPSEPDKISYIPSTALSYPFVVEDDPNPHGRAWLKAVLAEPA